jgi:hypothetical protein
MTEHATWCPRCGGFLHGSRHLNNTNIHYVGHVYLPAAGKLKITQVSFRLTSMIDPETLLVGTSNFYASSYANSSSVTFVPVS